MASVQQQGDKPLSSQAQKGGCYIAEILQYTCDPATVSDYKRQTRCFPIPRLFRICEGKPSVEITRFVDINMATGEIRVPTEGELAYQINAKPWRNVARKPTMIDSNPSTE